MPKTIGPLMSGDAHGALGKDLIFSHRRTGKQVRAFHRPKKEITLGQWTQRHIVGLLTAHWQCMSPAEKLVYEDLAKATGKPVTGFNWFIHLAVADLKTHHGLCGYWSMNEKTGEQVLDYSGQGNHGTLKPTYPSDCPVRVDSFRENYGKALSFDGGNDHVLVESADLNFKAADSFTISCWIKTTKGTESIIVDNRVAPTPAILLRVNANKINFLIHDGTNGATITGVTTVSDNVWHHVVAVRDVATDKVYLYIDSKQDKTPVSDPSGNVGTNLIKIGRHYSLTTVSFLGPIDEVRIYNRALSAPEILKQYELLRFGKKRQVW